MKDFLILIDSEAAQKLDSVEKGEIGIVCNSAESMVITLGIYGILVESMPIHVGIYSIFVESTTIKLWRENE